LSFVSSKPKRSQDRRRTDSKSQAAVYLLTTLSALLCQNNANILVHWILGVIATTVTFTLCCPDLNSNSASYWRCCGKRLNAYGSPQTYSSKGLPNFLAHISATLVHSSLSAYPHQLYFLRTCITVEGFLATLYVPDQPPTTPNYANAADFWSHQKFALENCQTRNDVNYSNKM